MCESTGTIGFAFYFNVICAKECFLKKKNSSLFMNLEATSEYFQWASIERMIWVGFIVFFFFF